MKQLLVALILIFSTAGLTAMYRMQQAVPRFARSAATIAEGAWEKTQPSLHYMAPPLIRDNITARPFQPPIWNLGPSRPTGFDVSPINLYLKNQPIKSLPEWILANQGDLQLV